MAIELKELQYAIISRLERFSSFLEIEDNKTKIEEICKRMFVRCFLEFKRSRG
jgi:hypothetical protein